MKSLATAVKRDAEKLSRQVSVAFDTICHEALQTSSAVQALGEMATSDGAPQELQARAEAVLADVPRLIRLAAIRVVEEQQRNPAGWLDAVQRWKMLYEAQKAGAVPNGIQLPAIVAQAYLNGIELAVQGKPIPAEEHQSPSVGAGAGSSANGSESWAALCRRALSLFREHASPSRYQLAESRLRQIKVQSTSIQHIQAGLLEWCRVRLNEVQPRTVKSQLDCMAVALRHALPQLETPFLRELKGVMQAKTTDRQSMPLQAIQEALKVFTTRPASNKVRSDYEGGASQFDAVAIEALAVLGMRPRELIEAKSSALCLKTDVFGNQGLYFRVVAGKNKASEREVPLSDGTREVVDVARLRAMLEWQESNPREPHGAVSSMQTRFKQVTKQYTLYQMRHSWKDVAVHVGVDFELRERILGHKVRGVAAVYGSGIPLQHGLDALMAVRSAIYSK